MASVKFKDDLCKGCGLCVTACVKKIISLSKDRVNDKGYQVAECIGDKCIGCAACAMMCPDVVITVEK